MFVADDAREGVVLRGWLEQKLGLSWEVHEGRVGR